MGLSMVHGIVERHGGEISIDSEPGAGTTVTLKFPITAPQADDPKPQSAPPVFTPRRIIVIDDDEGIADVIAAIVRNGGHTVEFFTDPREGVAKFKTEPFEVVITDLAMPGLSGLEVAADIKRMDPTVPIILLTGWGDDLDKQKIADAGINKILSKPAPMSQILNSIEECFTGRQTPPAPISVADGHGNNGGLDEGADKRTSEAQLDVLPLD
jgi:CheY-like chemotaxis protein